MGGVEIPENLKSASGGDVAQPVGPYELASSGFDGETAQIGLPICRSMPACLTLSFTKHALRCSFNTTDRYSSFVGIASAKP